MDIWDIPPLRPVQVGKEPAIVYPFYLYDQENSQPISLAYIVTWDITNGKISLNIKDQIKLNVPAETPDTLIALTIKKLYTIATSKSNSPLIGLLTCRDPYITQGDPIRGQIVSLIFDGEPGDNPNVYIVLGSGKSLEGYCPTEIEKNVPSINYDIAILYVKQAKTDQDSGDICPKLLSELSPGNQTNSIILEINDQKLPYKLSLNINSLSCYPIYPSVKARGNKFYPASITGLISPMNYEGVVNGAAFDILIGSIFVSPGGSSGLGKDLVKGKQVKYSQTYFIPSPAVLSVYQTNNSKWHDQALTIRAQDVPVIRLKTPLDPHRNVNIADYIRNMVKDQIFKSFLPESPLASTVYRIDRVNGASYVSVPNKVLRKVVDLLENLHLEGTYWNDLLEGLHSILEENPVSIKLFKLNNIPQSDSSENQIHADPKLIAKAVLNELVSYPVIIQNVNTSDSTTINNIIYRSSAVTYQKITEISGPLAEFLSNGSSSSVLYTHAKMNFTPARILSALYWALSIIDKRNRPSTSQYNRVLRDSGLVLIAWALMLAAYTYKHSGNNSRGWNPILLDRLSRSIGTFAVLTGLHGLTHILSQFTADTLSISRPDRYMRELTRVYTDDNTLLSVHNQRNRGLLIDGALQISSQATFHGDINVAVAQEGLYQVVKESNDINRINGIKDLCTELHQKAGSYVNGNCVNMWNLSVRSYLAAAISAPERLRAIANYMLEPFSLDGSDMSETYYPPQEIIVYLIEKQALGEKLPSSDIKAYVSQLAKSKLPLCFDGCEMCVMSDECPLVSSPVQQYLVSRSGAYLLCHSIRSVNGGVIEY